MTESYGYLLLDIKAAQGTNRLARLPTTNHSPGFKCRRESMVINQPSCNLSQDNLYSQDALQQYVQPCPQQSYLWLLQILEVCLHHITWFQLPGNGVRDMGVYYQLQVVPLNKYTTSHTVWTEHVTVTAYTSLVWWNSRAERQRAHHQYSTVPLLAPKWSFEDIVILAQRV